jgi:hypothetical protein
MLEFLTEIDNSVRLFRYEFNVVTLHPIKIPLTSQLDILAGGYLTVYDLFRI